MRRIGVNQLQHCSSVIRPRIDHTASNKCDDNERSSSNNDVLLRHSCAPSPIEVTSDAQNFNSVKRDCDLQNNRFCVNSSDIDQQLPQCDCAVFETMTQSCPARCNACVQSLTTSRLVSAVNFRKIPKDFHRVPKKTALRYSFHGFSRFCNDSWTDQQIALTQNGNISRHTSSDLLLTHRREQHRRSLKELPCSPEYFDELNLE